MTIEKSNQSGFSIVETLVVVAAVAVLSVGGWFIFQHNRTKVTNAAAGNQTTNQQTAPIQPAPAVTYLDIKEWGVKIPLSAPIKDAYYTVATNSTDTVWVGLRSLDSAGCAADLGNARGASAVIAAVIRVLPTDKDPVKGVPYTQLYPGMTINGYYYAYMSHPNNQCVPATTHQSINAAFGLAVKSAASANVN